MILRAAYAAALGCLFTVAGATSAAAQVTVNILNPSADLPEDDPIAIAVSVTSPAEVTSVEAQVGTKTATLTLINGNWFGYIDMSGLARGQHQLVVNATNAVTQTGQATRTFTLDRTPAIAITSPVDYALGLPEVRAKATCTDDGGPCQLTVGYVNGPLLAAGTGSIDTLIKPIEGTPRLEFVATDSTNRFSKIHRNVAIYSSTRLRSEQGFTGKILDIAADRALIYEDTASPAVVRIVDRTTNASQIIWTSGAPGHQAQRGFLTPAGALLVVFNTPSIGWELQEWRGGTLTLLGHVELDSVRVKGQWAIFSLSNSGQYPLVLRDLTTGTNTVVDADAGNERNDVTADGRVFYWDGTPSEIFRYEPGPPPTTTQLTFGAPAQSRFPVTDGVNVVFTRLATPPNPSPNPSTVLRKGDGTEIVLASQVFAVFPGDGYRVANGWVAFMRNGSNGTSEAWLRAPDGTERKISPAGGAYGIVGLSETGEVIIDTSAPSFVRRYLARTDGSLVNLGIPTGKPFFIDNAWYIAAGGQLLAVDATVPARSILSEGATGTFFSTDVAILNPHNSAVPVTIRYLRENAPEIEETRTLPAMSRTTIHEDDIPGLEGTSVSTVVEAPAGSPVVAERLMSWDASGYGGHLGTAVDRTRVRWFFAEGAQGFFHTFFLLANSGASEATVKFTFLIEQGTPVTHTVQVAPGTRKTQYAGDVADLINRSFATVVESDVPIVAERAMYFGDSPLWLGGHGSAGVPEPAYHWYHAEGATGSLFDTFILLANPNPVDVTVNLTYTTDKNQIFVRTKILPASSRLTINIEDEAPELVNTAVSTRAETVLYPIVSERAMYWGTTGAGWREAHNSFGVTEAGAKWGVAEGRSGGPRGYETYVLVSNPSPFSTSLRVTFIKEDGTVFVPAQPFDVAAESRLNIPSGAFPELANSNFSTIVESPNTGISVESAIYWNANGVIWEGGGNTTATRIQ
jgi:hypothetical protein